MSAPAPMGRARDDLPTRKGQLMRALTHPTRPQPLRNVPRPCDPGDRHDLAERMQQRPPAWRHFAVAVNLDWSDNGLRKADARAGELDQVLRPFHARGQPAQDFLFELVERCQARMRLAGEIDPGAPHLVERARCCAYHAGQILDRLELAELHARKRLAHCDFQIIGINRPQQPAGQTRGELTHGENLHAAFSSARRLDARHVPGEPGVDYDGAPQAHNLYPGTDSMSELLPCFNRG